MAIFLLLTLSLFRLGHSQTEFTSDSDFLYNQSTMDRLSLIVDSLNIRYRSCGYERDYLSLPQAMGHYFYLKTNHAHEIAKEMDNGMSFEDFEKKYKKATIHQDHLIVQFSYVNYKGDSVLEYSTIAINTYSGFEIARTPKNAMPVESAGKCMYEINEKGPYSDENIRGFFFTTNIEQTKLNEHYAGQIQYADCMVDTTASMYLKNADYERYSDTLPTPVTRFIEYVDRETNRPTYPENYKDTNLVKQYYAGNRLWYEERFRIIDEVLIPKKGLIDSLNGAIAYAIENGKSNEDLEQYAGKYHSKDMMLNLMRSRKVMGQCSMDDRPRMHAKEIAELSAEIANWEVFLRSHLDLMNDRFERMSDGSYAQPRRQTYIKELEALDINTVDLLLGISLRYQDPHPNHYFGSISRLGRALSESSKRDQFIEEIKAMCADTTLDDFNRVLAYFLLLNQAHHRQEDSEKEMAMKDAYDSVHLLPSHFVRRFEAARTKD